MSTANRFTDITTEDLIAKRDANLAALRKLRAETDDLNEEIGRRGNHRAFVINSVIEGRAQAMRDAGVSEMAIAEAEAYVAEERARKRQPGAEGAVQP